MPPLVAGLRAGDESAFSALLRRHQAPMLRIARIHVSCEATAEDVVQETWLGVIKGVDRFDGRSSLKTWIYRILTNRAESAGQRERRWVSHASASLGETTVFEATVAEVSAPVEESWPGNVEDALVTSEEVALVCTAINLLPAVQRQVITLRDLECWTPAEVGGVPGLTETNQRALLHRARTNVRRRVETKINPPTTPTTGLGRSGPRAWR